MQRILVFRYCALLVCFFVLGFVHRVEAQHRVERKSETLNQSSARVAGFSDTFEDGQIDDRWVFYNEGFANAIEREGRLEIVVEQDRFWFENDESWGLFQSVTGDFDFSTSATILVETGPGNGDFSMVPNRNNIEHWHWRFGGIIAHNPASSSGSRNYVFCVQGRRGNESASGIQFETKTTVNSVSFVDAFDLEEFQIDIRLRRVGEDYECYSRPYGTDETWALMSTFNRPDLPATLNVGLITYQEDTRGQRTQVFFDHFSDNTLLPVELTDFTAKLDGGDVLLEWETASETNNAGFEIQIKDVGQAEEGNASWERVAFVEGNGTTPDAQRYRYIVTALTPGAYAFRLKQIDFDGAFSYSGAVNVAYALEEGYIITDPHPNPFNPETQFELVVQRAQMVNVSVYDMLGRRIEVLFQGVVEAQENKMLMFSGGNIPSGFYFIRVQGDTFADTRRVHLIK